MCWALTTFLVGGDLQVGSAEVKITPPTGAPMAGYYFNRVDSVEMDPKPRPNRRIYLEALRQMTPEQRLAKAFELSEIARLLFRQGLRRRFPDLSSREFQKLYLKRLDLCHNRNY